MADDQPEPILKTTDAVRFVRQMLVRIPPLFFIVFWLRYRIEILRAKQLIIVTTPGHVGSSTVFNSLRTGQWPKGTRVYDIHSLRERFNNDSPVHSVSARHVLQEVLRSMVLKRSLRKKSVTVVSVVRDPVARALGGMFQNSRVFINGIEVDRLTSTDFESAFEHIYQQLVNDGSLANTAAWQLSFYKMELKEYWGFRMEDLIMNESVGILNNGSHKLILLTLEDLSNNFNAIAQKHLGVRPRLVVANNNTSTFYQFCKETLKIDEAILRPLYADPFFETVYGKDRLEAMMRRWLKR